MGAVFSEARLEPTSAAIREALGSRSQAWEHTSAVFAEAGVLVSWRYYRDRGWLAKATRGNKATAWLALEDGFVRVTFEVREPADLDPVGVVLAVKLTAKLRTPRA